MSSELATLTVLPVNKTVVFYSPVEGKDVLVRTGTIADGSCFFNALLHAYSKDYVSMNFNSRVKFVKRLRASIVDKSRWESLSNGLIAKIPFQENVNTILSDFYRYIVRGGKGRTRSVRKVIRDIIKNDTEAYKLIIEMIPLNKGFNKGILPSAYEKCNKSNIKECKKTVVEYAVRYYKKEFKKLEGQLSDDRVVYYVNKLETFIQSVVDEADNSAYSEYIESLHDTSMEVDSYTIGLISEKINRDVYFIDSSTRMPYMDSSNGNIRKRKSVVVMWTGGCHYEIVGRLLSGNRIQREFDYRDSLIKRIYTYIYKPEKIPSEYPDLIQYLSKDLRVKLHIYDSDSDENIGSDNGGKYVSSSDNIENSSEYEQSGSGSEYESGKSKQSGSEYEQSKNDLNSGSEYEQSTTDLNSGSEYENSKSKNDLNSGSEYEQSKNDLNSGSEYENSKSKNDVDSVKEIDVDS